MRISKDGCGAYFHPHRLAIPSPVGRLDVVVSAEWVDFNLFGHQFVCHLNPAPGTAGARHFALQSGGWPRRCPVPHCGLVWEMEVWRTLVMRLEQHQVKFVIEPYIRFKGERGEQATLFFLDPFGNALEFQGFQGHRGAVVRHVSWHLRCRFTSASLRVPLPA